jgi:hypothetical protein
MSKDQAIAQTEAIKRFNQSLVRQPAQPDCRTCEHLSDSKRYCSKSEHWMKGCTNGDQYQPAPAVVLWRTE